MATTTKPSVLGELVAEFLGTFVLIVLGIGVVAMVMLFPSEPSIPGEVIKGGYTNLTLGWGLAVFLGICVAGRVSGAHLNPAAGLAHVARVDVSHGEQAAAEQAGDLG